MSYFIIAVFAFIAGLMLKGDLMKVEGKAVNLAKKENAKAVAAVQKGVSKL
jgi:hypothetical protein